VNKGVVVAEVLKALMETSRKKKARDVLMPKAAPMADDSGGEMPEDELAVLMAIEPEDESEDDEEEA
jgi:hypothetical protein